MDDPTGRLAPLQAMLDEANAATPELQQRVDEAAASLTLAQTTNNQAVAALHGHRRRIGLLEHDFASVQTDVEQMEHAQREAARNGTR